MSLILGVSRYTFEYFDPHCSSLVSLSKSISFFPGLLGCLSWYHRCGARFSVIKQYVLIVFGVKGISGLDCKRVATLGSTWLFGRSSPEAQGWREAGVLCGQDLGALCDGIAWECWRGDFWVTDRVVVAGGFTFCFAFKGRERILALLLVSTAR